MRKEIPAPVIAVLSEYMPNFETHASLDNLFFYAEAPGDPPEESKPVKVQVWLRRINKEADQPLKVLGRIIENYMELSESEEGPIPIFGTYIKGSKEEFKNKIETALSRYNLTYITGGTVSDGASISSKTLGDLIKGRDIPSIDAEFTRALSNVQSEPREAVSAACNILESIFKIYIHDEDLEPPQKQDLQNVWKVVRSDLGFNPNLIQDVDLQKILTGMLSVVDGIGAFRTHASSAHGEGRKIYNLKPRHARLAINAAHTMALFILETWDEKKTR
ncbi:abortive infection family protein [Halomonas elongata]|uniref:abortive infection family protein n=1 Tax=Halomonas elongata TaxID=2746 RepID=UPI0038D3FA8C